MIRNRTKWLLEIIASIFVLVFLYTGINKLRFHEGFAGAMNRNPLIKPYSEILQWIIPIGELAIVALLLIPATRRLGLLLSTLLMAVFTVYVGLMLWKGGQLPCLCGGVLETMNWPTHLVFNSVLLVLGWFATLVYPTSFIAINRSSRKPEQRVGNTI